MTVIHEPSRQPENPEFFSMLGKRVAQYEDLERRLEFILSANENLGSFPYLIPEEYAYTLKASLERCKQSRETYEAHFAG